MIIGSLKFWKIIFNTSLFSNKKLKLIVSNRLQPIFISVLSYDNKNDTATIYVYVSRYQ